MKTFKLLRTLLVLQLFTAPMWSAVPPLPVVANAEVAAVDSGSGNGPHFVYYVFAQDLSSSVGNEYYRVYFELIATNSAHPLRATSNRINFLPEEAIGPGKQDYLSEVGDDWLTLSGFDESRLFEGVPWRYIETGSGLPPSSFPKKIRSLTEVYVGYRFVADDGGHFGWMKFGRSDTTFTNAFDLVASEWHPIPGAPIGAGLPPEIPVTTEVADDGAGNPVLRASWNGAVASWIFETTPDLTPPVTWTEYPAGSTSAEIPLDGSDTHRYFQLRRP